MLTTNHPSDVGVKRDLLAVDEPMSNTLHARRSNHGQSEVWLDDENKRRVIATNAVYGAVRKHCSKDEFEASYATTQAQLRNIAEVFSAGTMVHDLGLVK